MASSAAVDDSAVDRIRVAAESRGMSLTARGEAVMRLLRIIETADPLTAQRLRAVVACVDRI